MCGIAGIFAYHSAATPVDRAELRAIRDHMTARGPDGFGEWFSDHNRIGLAHRRLSIIDLSDRAAQPMASADGQLVISFNGEIYNYRELRRDIEARGHIFRTESDTEVLLHLYAEKGEAMLHDLRGMFAFAIWDARKQALFLARDPYGIKPLYYADDGWTCRFASQVKALLTSNKVSRLPEPAGLAGFYLFGSVPEPYTLYQEIRAVPAGCYQWIDTSGPHAPVQYFSLAQIWVEAEQAEPMTETDLQEQVREALLDTMRAHMVADVPVGAFLSAGIDSGALVGLMSEIGAFPSPPLPTSGEGAVRAFPTRKGDRDKGQSWLSTNRFCSSPTRGGGWEGESLTTITLAFEEFRHTHADEAPLAEKLARHYGVEHTVRTVNEAEFRADLPKILAAMDQPSIDGINTWFVSKAASEAGLKVALSGVGGDELFGGYPSFRDIPKWVRRMWLPSHVPGLGALAEQVQAAFAPLFPRINPKAAGMLRYGGSYPGAWLLKRGLFLPHELPALIGKELAQEGLRRLQPLQHIQRQLVTANNPSPPQPSPQVGREYFAPLPRVRETGIKDRAGYQPTGFGPPPRVEEDGISSDLPACGLSRLLRGFIRGTSHAQISILESALYMRNQLLRDTDWASMAHSLEVRTPLVDATLLRKLAGPLAHAGAGNHKHLLAASPAKPLPDEIASRAKSGFTTPIATWQQRGDNAQAWQGVPALKRENCPWARRWAYTVEAHFK